MEVKTDTRQEILDTAERLVARKGYAAVGLREILGEAGVPKGSFYHYFGSKDAFGRVLVESYFDNYLATMDRIVAEADKRGADHLMRYWQSFYERQVVDDCQGRCLVVKLGAEVSDLSEAMRMAMKLGTTAIVERVERMIVAGVADGSVVVDATPAATAEALYDTWLGASVMAKIHRSSEYLDRAMALTRLVLHV